MLVTLKEKSKHKDYFVITVGRLSQHFAVTLIHEFCSNHSHEKTTHCSNQSHEKTTHCSTVHFQESFSCNCCTGPILLGKVILASFGIRYFRPCSTCISSDWDNEGNTPGRFAMSVAYGNHSRAIESNYLNTSNLEIGNDILTLIFHSLYVL